MRLTEKQLKKIIKESVLNAMAEEGLHGENNEEESYPASVLGHYPTVSEIADALGDYLYAHSRKAIYFRRILNRGVVPETIADNFSEVIESLEAALNGARMTLMEIIKSGFITEYQKSEAIKALEASNKALSRD